jgi:hypothetical protein
MLTLAADIAGFIAEVSFDDLVLTWNSNDLS